MQKNYPDHIYEPIRREIAVSYIRHELRKYFPSLKDENAWKNIDSDMASWFEEAPFLSPVRDFWNGFYGILMGFKLLIHLSDFVTAENIIWKREAINIKGLVFTGFNPTEFGVPMVTMAVSEAIDFYTMPGNEMRRMEDLAKLQATFTKTTNRSDDPVIVTQKKVEDKDRLAVCEGNARVYLAVLHGKNTIDAYVGRFVDERRRLANFWVPTSYLLELAHLARAAWREKDDELYQATARVLAKTLTFSESAKFEMKDRAVHKPEEFKQKLLTDLRLI